MTETLHTQDSLENRKEEVGLARTSDIPAILQIQNDRSLSNALQSGQKEDIERGGFLIHMISEDELKRLIDTPEDVMILSCRENGEVVGYAIGYAMRVWKGLHPGWGKSIRFSEGNFQEAGEDAMYFRHVATSPHAKVGVGARLSRELIKLSQERGFHKVLAEILKEPYSNKVSLLVHMRMGFKEIGEIDEVFEGREYRWGLFEKVLVPRMTA